MAEKALSKVQKAAVAALEAAQTMQEVTEAVAGLGDAERQDRRIAQAIYEHTSRIVG